MAEVFTFKVDDTRGVPDRLLKEWLTEQEHKLGPIDVHMIPVTSKTAVLLTVVVVKKSV